MKKSVTTVSRREFLVGAGACVASAAWAVPGGAGTADFPGGRPVTMVLHASAGGGFDVGVRALQPYLEAALGSRLVVTHQPASAGLVMLTQMSKAKPDGYTVGSIYLPGFNAMWLDSRRQPTFKRKDFKFVAGHVWDPCSIIVKPGAPWTAFPEFVKDAKAKPGALSIGLGGIVSDDHLFLLDIMAKTGTDIKLVHFDASAPAITAFLGGHVQGLCVNEAEAGPLVKRGDARFLALGHTRRSKYFPDVPILREQGIDVTGSAIRGFLVPAEVPQPIFDVLATAFKDAITNPEHVKKMDGMGFPVAYLSPQEFTETVLREDAKVTMLAKQFKLFDPLPQD
jgi:tripartite-type tricarboxylate transporter receptor subunit TctC